MIEIENTGKIRLDLANGVKWGGKAKLREGKVASGRNMPLTEPGESDPAVSLC